MGRTTKAIATRNRFNIVFIVVLPRGTPQGSILDPLLFITYSADFIQVIKQQIPYTPTNVKLYISEVPQRKSNAILLLNEDLNAIAEWSVSGYQTLISPSIWSLTQKFSSRKF